MIFSIAKIIHLGILRIVILSNSMTEYLSRHPESKVLDVLTEGSTIEKLLKNCSVISETYEIYYYNTYKQNAISAVIDFFSKKEEKPTKEEFEKAYNAFFNPNRSLEIRHVYFSNDRH